MSGTITDASLTWYGPAGSKAHPLPVAKGDHVTWALQYESSTPVSGSGPGSSSYSPTGPLITSLVDQTNGNNGFTDGYYPSPWSPSGLSLASTASSSSLHVKSTSQGVDFGNSTELNLGFNGSLPTSPLASFPLTSLRLNPSASSLKYTSYAVPVESFSFTTSVDSLSVAAPEPGSLTLLLLGAAGLTLYTLRTRLGRRLQPA